MIGWLSFDRADGATGRVAAGKSISTGAEAGAGPGPGASARAGASVGVGAGVGPQRFPAMWILAGFAVAALALLALEFTDVDMHLQRLLYDPLGATFVWRNDAQIEFWLHHRLKQLLYLLPLLALSGWWRAWRLSGRRGQRRRHGQADVQATAARRSVRRWRYLFIALLAAPLIVTVTKDLTNRPCPWDVVEFGGQQRHHGLFVPAPPDSRRLACFPAGHASAGFALFAFALAGGWPGLLTPMRAGSARGWWLAGLALGLSMGAVRMAQGAHFMSHVLWCAWLVGLVQWALARWLLEPGDAAPCSARTAIHCVKPPAA